MKKIRIGDGGERKALTDCASIFFGIIRHLPALTLDPPLECVCHLMHGSVRCIVVVCLSFVVVVFFSKFKAKSKS